MVLILAVPTMEAQDKKKDWKDRWKAEKSPTLPMRWN